MAFLIIAGVLLLVNAIFLAGSLVYTLKTTTSKGERKLSTASRLSNQPQIALYQAIVRISGVPVPNFDEQPSNAEKDETPEKQ